jgi:hypothetical protein
MVGFGFSGDESFGEMRNKRSSLDTTFSSENVKERDNLGVVAIDGMLNRV